MNKLFSNARTTEVDDTSDRLLLAYNAQTGLVSDAFLKTIFDDIHSLSDQITDAIKRDLVFSEMEDADENVAIALRSVFTVLKGYEAMPLVQLSTAAKVLTPVADKYTLSILRLNYAAQSSNVEALLMDLSAPALKASIDVLPGVAEAIANLRAAQTAFIEKRVDYEKAMALKTAGTPASELKKPLLDLINSRLIPYLDVNKMVDSATYGHLTDLVEQIVNDTNTGISRRSKKKDTVTAS